MERISFFTLMNHMFFNTKERDILSKVIKTAKVSTNVATVYWEIFEIKNLLFSQISSQPQKFSY